MKLILMDVLPFLVVGLAFACINWYNFLSFYDFIQWESFDKDGVLIEYKVTISENISS